MFEVVSFETFRNFILSQGSVAATEIEKMYNSIRLPVRSTVKSAGYDFFSPVGLHIPANRPVMIPTGIKVDLSGFNNRPNEGKFLAIYPRSSYGIKYNMALMNTVGIIDEDYYNNPDNEGHILIAIHSLVEFDLEMGTRFCQGIVQSYFIQDDEAPTALRVGGTGSTDLLEKEIVVATEEDKEEPIFDNIAAEEFVEEEKETIEPAKLEDFDEIQLASKPA